MMEWWSSLESLEQIMACIAIPATLVLIVQIVVILFSSFGEVDFDNGDFGTADDIDDIDGNADGIGIFTVKGVVTFFTIFGWSGLLFLRMDMYPLLALLLAFFFGVLFMFFIALALKGMLKLQDCGNMDYKTALGVSGTVYMTIPKNRTGMGKVTAIVSGRYAEFDAVCDEEEIPTGSSVVVVALSATNVLVVAKK